MRKVLNWPARMNLARPASNGACTLSAVNALQSVLQKIPAAGQKLTSLAGGEAASGGALLKINFVGGVSDAGSARFACW